MRFQRPNSTELFGSNNTLHRADREKLPLLGPPCQEASQAALKKPQKTALGLKKWVLVDFSMAPKVALSFKRSPRFCLSRLGCAQICLANRAALNSLASVSRSEDSAFYFFLVDRKTSCVTKTRRSVERAAVPLKNPRKTVFSAPKSFVRVFCGFFNASCRPGRAGPKVEVVLHLPTLAPGFTPLGTGFFKEGGEGDHPPGNVPLPLPHSHPKTNFNLGLSRYKRANKPPGSFMRSEVRDTHTHTH